MRISNASELLKTERKKGLRRATLPPQPESETIHFPQDEFAPLVRTLADTEEQEEGQNEHLKSDEIVIEDEKVAKGWPYAEEGTSRQFKDYGLDKNIIKVLDRFKVKNPFEIQVRCMNELGNGYKNNNFEISRS